jgi:hypothetical protein
MNIRSDIAEFIVNLEVFSKRKLTYPLEVGELLQIAVETGLTDEFEELIFQAKFLTWTQDVMRQISHDAEGFEKLSTEFNSGIKISMELMKMLVGRAAVDVTRRYSEGFFAIETESISRLMKLYSDLSWVKNWQIDGKSLPYETKSPVITSIQENVNFQTIEKQQNNKSIKHLSRIQKSAMLSVILLVLFLLIDPPATILGWIISLWIAALLTYIVVQILFLTRRLIE